MNTTSNVTTCDDQHTIIKVSGNDVLALLGDNGENWIKGDWDNDQKMCLHGAIRRCSPQPGDAYIVEQVAKQQGWGTGWNDDDTTDWQAVKARIVAGIEVTDKMLADTYGQQWEHIVNLVRRVAVLTADEATSMVDTRNVALGAAWDDAWYDKRLAAWLAAGEAAGRVAGEDARYAARLVARNAAVALAVRDLIGQNDFTQEHYDALTEPWAKVIGPAHPDDTHPR